MSTVKTKFTLHENYEDFKRSVLKHEAKILAQSTPHESIGCLSLKVIFTGFMLITGVFMVYFLALEPFLFQHFSQVTTAQVIDCKMSKTKQYGPIPNLTYSYIWNNQSFINSTSIYGYHMDGCDVYLNQTVAIRVLEPDPSQVRLIAAETSRPIIEDIGMIAAFLCLGAFGAAGSYLYLHAITLKIRARIWPYPTKQGILLEGEIITIQGNSPLKTQPYIVKITYGFEAPRKRYLTGHAQARRDDLRDVSLPSIGTPVAILYADDQSHMML